jgi:hypothetical protein
VTAAITSASMSVPYSVSHPVYGTSTYTAQSHYVLDPQCVWQYLQHFEEEDDKKSPGSGRSGSSARVFTSKMPPSQSEGYDDMTKAFSRAEVISVKQLESLGALLDRYLIH